MRVSLASVANLTACAVLCGLAALAVVLVVLLGPFGLVLLGLLTLGICTGYTLDEHAPTWSAEVFHARMTNARSPEERAASAADRQAALSPIPFYRACGAVLVTAGLAGLAWQRWG